MFEGGIDTDPRYQDEGAECLATPEATLLGVYVILLTMRSLGGLMYSQAMVKTMSGVTQALKKTLSRMGTFPKAQPASDDSSA